MLLRSDAVLLTAVGTGVRDAGVRAGARRRPGADGVVGSCDQRL
ncbi:hypothetical protein AB6N23_03970 [Cellulomonas sp. 179-A 9B4 NHS]